ncbi:MAG: hypothetical protein ACD_51C00187G0002 [uncultured bacterium]|nr:MAG: hypothetical protein ACD_51C00187G0002 [uncultured bacterium]
MNTMTHLVYEDLFNQIEKNGLTLPISCLEDEKIIDEMLQELVSPIDPIEAISYSSFLNMVVQTSDPGESARLGQREIVEVGFSKNTSDRKVFFHRDCLLYMISQVIRGGKNGTMQITGGTDRRGTRKYYKSLLLINSKINRANGNARHTLLKDYFIRDYPLSYAPNATSTIFKNRLQRYWYIYSRMLPSMGKPGSESISMCIRILEEDSGLTLQKHYSVLAGVLSWFLLLSVEKRKKKNENITVQGFDYRNPSSFYIDRNNFPATDNLIRLIQFVAQDMDCLRKHFVKERRDKVSGFYKNFREFFDRPIFKIDDNRFCILDLKFLMEGLCSGFLWRIKDNASVQNNFQQIKGYYGQLIERYFIFLLEQIFGARKVRKTPGQGADAMVETDDCLLIFEFTTEYYRFASLYNAGIDYFVEDLERILFHCGKNNSNGRAKKDKGKFLKLNEYLNTPDKQRKKIIPILVTENYLGDYDLLNQFNNILDTNTEKCALNNIQQHKPLIICLDDLEIFWALTNEDEAVGEVGRCFNAWEAASKGAWLYDFSSFISSQDKAVITNDNYLKFFDYSKFWSELVD